MPDLEFNLIPQDHVLLWKRLQKSNWVQELEGNIDSSHLSFLHARLDAGGSTGFPGRFDRGMYYGDKAPFTEVLDTDCGVMYGAGRGERPGLT